MIDLQKKLIATISKQLDSEFQNVMQLETLNKLLGTVNTWFISQKNTHIANYSWQCGCGHWNGMSSTICAVCNRTPHQLK